MRAVPSGRNVRLRPFHEDDGGFSTLGMVLALLLSLSLIFTAGQVYRVNTASAAVQDVADAAALAAENEVAEFMILVRVCDALVLTLTLTSLVAFSLSLVALCIPATAGLAEKLLEAGKTLVKARDSFSDKASEGLDVLQKALPFLSAANAAAVAMENRGPTGNSRYVALAVLVPDKGEPIVIEPGDKTDEMGDDLDDEADDIEDDARDAEEAAEKANEAKQAAFDRDCGDNPRHCLYERAKTLAGMSGSSNPFYSNVDAWSFAVPLDRAKRYYHKRYSSESPHDGSVKERARSALRKHFYLYAISEVGKGYVHDSEKSFDAYFPLLPRNSDEMRQTSLYDQVIYPVTRSEYGLSMMHAWSGCPRAVGVVATRSLHDLDRGIYTTCPDCEFTAASMGSVAAASTSIDNGFEYHYREIARLAEEYEKARDELDPKAEEVKKKAQEIIDALKKALKEAADKRIDARPPGSYGAVSMVADLSTSHVQAGLGPAFVSGKKSLGPRVAVSGATLLAEDSSEGATVISSILDGFNGQDSLPVGAGQVLLGCWSNLLQAYTKGQQALTRGLATGLDSIPLASQSGLGDWAAEKVTKAISDAGLQPAKVDSLKPVLANTGNVTKKDGGAFAVNFREIKGRSATFMSGDADVFSTLLSKVEQEAVDRLGDEYTLATLEPFGSWGPSIPLTVTLPQPVQHAGEGLVSSLIARLRGLVVQVTGVSSWS